MLYRLSYDGVLRASLRLSFMISFLSFRGSGWSRTTKCSSHASFTARLRRQVAALPKAKGPPGSSPRGPSALWLFQPVLRVESPPRRLVALGTFDRASVAKPVHMIDDDAPIEYRMHWAPGRGGIRRLHQGGHEV